MSHKFKKFHPDKLREYVSRHPNATQRQIAGHFSCSQGAIQLALKRYNISYAVKSRSGNKQIKPENLRAFILEHPHATQRQIAAYFGCNPSTISEAIKRNRISYGNKKSAESRIKYASFSKKLREYVIENPNAARKQISAYFNCSEYIIRSAIELFGIPYVKKRRRYPKLRPELLREYIQEHPFTNQAEIAALIGCDPSCVSRALKKYGISYIPYLSRIATVEKLKEYVHKNPFAKSEQIERALGIPMDCITDLRCRYKINKDRETWRAEAIRAFIREHPGSRQYEIADHFDVSPSIISKKLKEYDIKLCRRVHSNNEQLT